MRVRLIRKLARQLDGVDVSGCAEGDVLDLARHDAELLIAEGWAVVFRAAPRRERRYVSCSPARADAADGSCAEPRPQRRAEDRVGGDLSDRCTRAVKPDKT